MDHIHDKMPQLLEQLMSAIVNKKYKISVHTINNTRWNFQKNFIPLTDHKIEAGADLVRTITSNKSSNYGYRMVPFKSARKIWPPLGLLAKIR